MWFRVAKASEYLVVTGAGISDIKLAKKAWILPGQSCTKFDICAVNYTFKVQAMSSKKQSYILPAVFTIGPRADDDESLMKYAKLIAPHDKHSNHVQELVQGVIEGETRALAASMTMGKVFNGARMFKLKVFEKVQFELDQFGLVIYNDNIKQLVSTRGRPYFSNSGQKIQMETANQAKIDVAEAKKKGEIGAKLREGETAQNAAKIDAETKIYSTQRNGIAKKEDVKVKTEVQIYENERAAEVAEANAELATKKASWQREAQVAQVEAEKAVKLREAELEGEVERKNAMTQTEKLKAEFLSQASVDYETKVQQANWELYQQQKKAEATLFNKEKEASAKKLLAKASFYTQQQEADAKLYAKKKEAEGILVLAQAQGTYLHTLLEALGGNYVALRDYMMINNNTFQEIVKINAEAIKGLQPEISVWTHGCGGGDESSDGWLVAVQ